MRIEHSKIEYDEILFNSWIGESMDQYFGVCGCICSDCVAFSDACKGCRASEGKPGWLDEVSLDCCDFYSCCVLENKLTHCGECFKIPCNKFHANKNPALSNKEHKRMVSERVEKLTLLAKKNRCNQSSE